LPYCIAAGNVALAVQHLTSRGHLSDAVLVAAAADEGGMPSLSKKPRQRSLRKFHTEDSDQETRF